MHRQPWPFSLKAHPGWGHCSPSRLAGTLAMWVLPFLPPAPHNMTFSIPSFFALSQWGFHTLCCSYNCVHEVFWASGLGMTLPILPLCNLYTYSFLLPPLHASSFPLCVSLPTSTKHFDQLHCLRYPHHKLLITTNTKGAQTSPRLTQSFFPPLV